MTAGVGVATLTMTSGVDVSGGVVGVTNVSVGEGVALGCTLGSGDGPIPPTVTWRRAGSAPELAAPPFLARSTDGIAYDAPGPMTHVGDGWLLDGVALPANGFAWLRVDGVLSGGAGANSRGVVDGVRQLWRSDRLFADGFE